MSSPLSLLQAKGPQLSSATEIPCHVCVIPVLSDPGLLLLGLRLPAVPQPSWTCPGCASVLWQCDFMSARKHFLHQSAQKDFSLRSHLSVWETHLCFLLGQQAAHCDCMQVLEHHEDGAGMGQLCVAPQPPRLPAVAHFGFKLRCSTKSVPPHVWMHHWECCQSLVENSIA